MEDTRIKSSSSVCKANALPMVLSLWPIHHRFPSVGARTQHLREFLRELKPQVGRKNPSLLEKESGFDLHDCLRPFSAPKERNFRKETKGVKGHLSANMREEEDKDKVEGQGQGQRGRQGQSGSLQWG